MASIEYAGVVVQTDAEGYLLDDAQWTPEIGEAIARAFSVERLTTRHWSVIAICREQAAREGRPPTLSDLALLSGIDEEGLRGLFPGDPRQLVARIAGLRKPVEPTTADEGPVETDR